MMDSDELDSTSHPEDEEDSITDARPLRREDSITDQRIATAKAKALVAEANRLERLKAANLVMVLCAVFLLMCYPLTMLILSHRCADIL